MFLCNSDMDQLTEKPEETVAATGKADSQELVVEGILTRNRTGSFTKGVPRTRVRSLSGSSQSDILAPDSDKQPSSLVKRVSAPARPEQVAGEPVKGRRRRRTKAQIAADNAAKQALLEAERKEAAISNVPALPKKPGRPRGRPKKVRTTPPIPVETPVEIQAPPVETQTPPVVRSPTPPLQSEDPLPSSLNTSQESFESPLTDRETAGQESAKFTDEPSSDFNMNTDQHATVASMETTTLLKEDELKLLKEGTPLLKEDTSPLPIEAASVSEAQPYIMDTEPPVEEGYEQVETKNPSEMTVTKDQVVPQEASPSFSKDRVDISMEDKAMDSIAPEQPMETIEEPTELMDTSPTLPAPVESPIDKAENSSSDVQVPESAAEISCTPATTSDESISSPMTVAVETATQDSIIEPVTTITQLTNSESMFVDSLLSSHVVTASSNNSNATFVVSSSISTMTTAAASTNCQLPAFVPSSAVALPINSVPINQLPPIVPSLLPSLMSASLPVQVSTAVSSASSDLCLKTSVSSGVNLTDSTCEMDVVKSAQSTSVSFAAANVPSLIAKSLMPVTSASAVSTTPVATMSASATFISVSTASAPASAELARDVAKLDPLPINLNTTLSVTLPTLSSLLTTPSGQQKLVLPLEKLVLPSTLDSHSSGSYISSPISVNKPGNSCSYVITSMNTKEDPVSLAPSSLAHPTKSSIQTVSSQKSSSALQMPIFSSMPLLEPKKPDKPETTVVENKLREIAPKTLGIELHQLTSDIGRSSGAKKPELYEVLSNLKNAARSVSAEVKSSPNATLVTAPGTISISKEKHSDHTGTNQTMVDQSQHKPRPIAIKPDGMEFLKQINPAAAAAAAATSRTYPTVHPLFPLTASTKTGNLLPAFDLFRSSTAQKQFSTQAANISSVLPHLPGSSIAAYPTQKAPPPLISITDGVKPLNVLGSVRVAVIDAPVTGTAHQSLSSIPAHMKVNNRPPQQPPQRPPAPQQSQTLSNAPIIATPLLSLARTISAPPTTFSSAVQQQHMPHPLTVGVHASANNKVLSSSSEVVRFMLRMSFLYGSRILNH